MVITKKIASQDYVVETATEIIYAPQELTDEQKESARVNIGFPSITAEDAGKVLKVSPEGKLVLEAISSAVDIPYAEEATFGGE